MVTNSLICAVDFLAYYPLHMERLTPSQAAGGRALLRVMLWCSEAAAVAVLALRSRQLAGPGLRRWIRLGLAQAALACTAATHGINIYLIFFHVPVSPQDSSRLISLVIAVGGIILIAAADLFFFVVLLHGDDGAEEEE